MEYQTAVPRPVKGGDQLWRPANLYVERGDYYLVVDDIYEGKATLIASAWPRVDSSGRLFFDGPEETHALAFQTEDLAVVLRQRQFANQRPNSEMQDRELRIGDTFLIRAEELTEMARWKEIVDITAEARVAAKAAFYGAVAPRMDMEEASRIGLLDQGDSSSAAPNTTEPPAGGPSAAPPAV